MVKKRNLKPHLITVLGLLVLLIGGCQGKPAATGKPAQESSRTQPQNGTKIWEETLDAYATADSYRDEAVLYLSYRLHGQLIQEPQPWAVRWTKDQRLAANLFNTQLRSDGSRLGCFVYDIDTANLDNQWLVLEQSGVPPLETLFADGLARYFAGGFAEIPLDETPAALIRAMTPPTIGWLTGQIAWDWLHQPRLVERLKDSLVDNRPCYHLKLHGDKLSAEVWIDQESRLVRQMTLPIELLDPAVRTAVELSEVQFFARMHKAELNAALPVEDFAVVQPRDATPVQQFVALPEPFPCAAVGKELPNLRLSDTNGTFVDLSRETRPIVLVWISGMLGQEALTELQQAMLRPGSEQARWVAVFSDDQAESGNGIGRRPFAELRKWVSDNQLTCEWMFDSELAGSRSLLLETLPAAVVVNPQHQVEYAVSLGTDRWTERLVGALQRIQRGERVATEMLADYQAYLSRYKRKLQLVSAQKLIGPAARRSAASAESAAPLVFNEQSFSRELQRPGNLYLRQAAGIQEVLAFDGWQTIVRMNRQGGVLERIKLPVPEGTAATCLRFGVDSKDQPLVAVWSALGKEVFVLDAAWREVHRLSLGDLESRESILDCRFGKSSEGNAALWVSFDKSGLQQFNLESGTWSQVEARPIESFAFTANGWVGVGDDQLWAGQAGANTQPVQGSAQLYTRVLSSAAWNSAGEFLATGVAGDGIWELAKLRPDGTRISSAMLGPQLFEQPLEPADISFGEDSTGVIAWADSLNRVHLFSANLESLGTWTSPDPIQGLAIFREGSSYVLLVSLAKEIRAVRF